MNKALLVVDIQPEYKQAMGTLMLKHLMTHLNTTKQPIMAMWVGNGLSGDTIHEVMDFMVEHGLAEERIDEITFIEKDFAFYRPWMDQNVDDDVVVKVASAMLERKVTSSAWLPLDSILDESELDSLPRYDQIQAPCFSGNEGLLRSFNKLHICGGGRNECLKEIELYLQAISQDYAVLDHFVY